MKNILKKFVVLFSLGFVLFGFNSNVFAMSENITQINFTSDPQEIVINTNSQVFTLQTQNIENSEENTSSLDEEGSTTHLILSSDSLTGQFSDANISNHTCNESTWNNNLTLSLSSGSANKGFCYKNSTPGTYTLNISADGKDWTPATQDIIVVDNSITLSNISITTPATKLDYIIGETLDITGLEVIGTYTDNSTQVESITTDNITGFNSSVFATDQVLTIAFNTQTTTYTVNILEKKVEPNLSSIFITTSATKLNYKVGEVIDISGLVVTGTYNDGSTKVETVNTSNITGFDSSVAVVGQVLTITVNDKTTTYNVDISGPVEESNGGGSNNPVPMIVVDSNIILHDNCSIEDTVGKTHLFPQEDSPSKFLGICALAQIKTSGNINSFNIVDYPFGLFIDSINNIKDPSSAYWALYLNDIYEMRGLATLPLVAGDKVSLIYVDFNNAELGSRIDIKIDALALSPDEPAISSGGTGGGVVTPRKDFSIENALSFLSLQQKEDGSFGDFLYTDWVGIAFASVKENFAPKEKVINYLKTTPLVSSLATDNERHAISLMSLGINPYSGTEINYIKKIVDSFDGTQFGDPNLVNDDIFAIFPLIKAGYDSNDEMIKKDTSFILSKQETDGSWGSVDLTSSAIQALLLLPSSEAIMKSKIQAEQYLKNVQKLDGGFENSFSTSWVLGAIAALQEDILTWTKNNLNPINYLASLQQSDGGVEFSSADKNIRIWATSYAITAVGNKAWVDIMQSFPKPTTNVIDGNINKKDVQTPKIKNVKKPENLEFSENKNPEIVTPNNLGASAGNIDISIKNVVHKASLPFVYIGKSFLNLVNFVFGF